MSPPTPLTELARLFLRLGATSFGGPAAHIAMMQDEVVRKRGWMSATAFLDALSATNLIPGPNSTELAMHVGHQRAGARGLVVAGVCFIVPAALIIGVLAAGYARYASVPDVGFIFYGIKPVVIAIVAVAVWTLGRTTITTMMTAAVAAGALVMLAAGVHELLVLAVSGAAAVVFASGTPRLFAMLAVTALAGAAPAPAAPFGLGLMFLLFLKTGAVLFGSGYVLLAFLRADFVERLGWLTEQQLLDAIAIGQITPGPVFTTATFIGYLLGGPVGAVAATVGIFLPAFVFVALTRPLVDRMRRSARTAALLDGINAGSLAMMVFVLGHLARSAITDALTLTIAAVSLVAISRYRVNAAWLMAGGAAAGWIFVTFVARYVSACASGAPGTTAPGDSPLSGRTAASQQTAVARRRTSRWGGDVARDGARHARRPDDELTVQQDIPRRHLRRATRCSIVASAASPICRLGCRSVVSGTGSGSAKSASSIPTRRTSAGTPWPSPISVRISRAAVRSLAQTIPSGGRDAISSLTAAASSGSMRCTSAGSTVAPAA